MRSTIPYWPDYVHIIMRQLINASSYNFPDIDLGMVFFHRRSALSPAQTSTLFETEAVRKSTPRIRRLLLQSRYRLFKERFRTRPVSTCLSRIENTILNVLRKICGIEVPLGCYSAFTYMLPLRERFFLYCSAMAGLRQPEFSSWEFNHFSASPWCHIEGS